MVWFSNSFLWERVNKSETLALEKVIVIVQYFFNQYKDKPVRHSTTIMYFICQRPFGSRSPQ